MHYSFDEYDEHGWLKPPMWLWFGWAILIRSVVVFVMAGASREQGTDLLALFYPNHTHLYTSLYLSLPIVFFMWLSNFKKPTRPLMLTLWKQGRWLTIIMVLIDLTMLIQSVVVNRGEFQLGSAVIILFLSWFLIFLFRSKRVKICFSLT
ncbi:MULTISPECIES: DUF2919 domain-containing protein [unclassified Aliivibrio]|jgi:hypothetical protein|uniref:DUF2919 domain-containing protein n=1 Tax=unclassified Aliivibrio TaxID=2645654 RepID=UPI00080E02F5|nr:MULTISPECIES: DUF2919 domain-containing protein [unclassified Aliivibrio]OCH12924.1 competence protein ComE [Aliivibrio sp. 1S165]OCH24145.1 competence protein ComE [Aliivibrio sp. 1S128]OCH28387.1 competence protein ComE [Aliivibrio sp. 1S175]